MYLKSDSDLYKWDTWTDEEYLNVFVVISYYVFKFKWRESRIFMVSEVNYRLKHFVVWQI